MTSVRIDAFPDGGLSRVRVIGAITAQARQQAGYRWLDSLPASQARRCLTGAGLEPDAAADVAAQRPLTRAWIEDSHRTLGQADSAALAQLLNGHGTPPSSYEEHIQ